MYEIPHISGLLPVQDGHVPAGSKSVQAYLHECELLRLIAGLDPMSHIRSLHQLTGLSPMRIEICFQDKPLQLTHAQLAALLENHSKETVGMTQTEETCWLLLQLHQGIDVEEPEPDPLEAQLEMIPFENALERLQADGMDSIEEDFLWELIGSGVINSLRQNEVVFVRVSDLESFIESL